MGPLFIVKTRGAPTPRLAAIMVKESRHFIDNRRSLSRKNPVTPAGVKCVQILDKNYGALGQTARACIGVLRTRDERRALKKETWSEIGVKRKERRRTPVALKNGLNSCDVTIT
ncbi:hypothetical protein TNCV_455761 [Trichonephila clavipes]|nr:hypothetical protein TNCV_455761 [Trichonephila clavipes]